MPNKQIQRALLKELTTWREMDEYERCELSTAVKEADLKEAKQ